MTSPNSGGNPLGYLLAFTIAVGGYELDALEKKYNFSFRRFREVPLPSAAFKNATNHVKYRYNRKGSDVELSFRQAPNKKNAIIRQLYREEKHLQRKTLRHEKIGELVLELHPADNTQYKTVLNLDHESFHADEHKHIVEMMREVERSFKHYRGATDHMLIRAAIRAYINSLDSIELRNATYFVPRKHEKEIESLTNMVNDFGPGCHMLAFAIADNAVHREMLLGGYERDTVDTCRGIELVIDHSVEHRIKRYKRLLARLDRMRNNRDLYKDMLKVDSFETDERLKAIEQKFYDYQEGKLFT